MRPGLTHRAFAGLEKPVFRPYGRPLSVHLFPQMRNAAKIKTTISPTIDAVKSQLHTTEVFRFITQPNYATNAGLDFNF
jgi:GTP:adenosylcobinamide-phosphate guanylyltransferase